MTKFKLLLIFTVVFAMFSCSSDDEPENSNSLIGTWEGTAIIMTGETSIEGTPVNVDMEAVSFDNYQMIFEADGTFTRTGSYILEYTVTGDLPGLPQTSQQTINAEETGTFNRDGDSVSLTNSEGEQQEMTIIIFEGNTLKYTTTETSNDVTATGTITYKRIQ